MRSFFTLSLLVALISTPFAEVRGDEPLHERIDGLIRKAAKGKAFSEPSDDAEFVRRVHLDFAGRIPSAEETRAFLGDKSADKRSKLIDRLLADPDYAVRMSELFNVMLMERLGDHAAWKKYLQESFAKNKPWDEMVREMLSPTDKDGAKGAAFFLSKRLENYGQNPVDYPALTRDIGRLFMGKDFRCAQCHDHLFIEDYKQRDFQGLYAFVKNVSLQRGDMPAVAETPTTEKLEFSSVFLDDKSSTGPRVPGLQEVSIPDFKKGEEYLVKPDRKKRTPGIPKFSTLKTLGEQLPSKANSAFSKNIVNRLWFVMMGRGLVHPLDLDHTKNPPSHPELLELLASEFVAHKYDLRWMLRELALTETYQRSSLLPKGAKESPDSEFRTAIARRLQVEQLLRSMLEATGEGDIKGGATFASARGRFMNAFAYPAREPDDEFNPTLKAALFLLNDTEVQGWLRPKAGNLLDRLGKMKDAAAVEELYVSILSRLPNADEARQVGSYLGKNGMRREAALRNVAWALIGSTEFCVNH